MKKLLHNCKGMVTVMVTLLLIPSLLITGTAVDIARIYAAKSILHDANQLAANSALTQYDALLQDLYGLYGIMQDDPVLANLIDQYIETSIMGQEGRATGLGTFQIFYGSDIKPGAIAPAQGQNLANAEVLRRQIEEYAKFRVPVVLIDELLGRLENFQNVQKDAKVIEDKMDIDDRMEDLEKTYEKIYDDIADLHAKQNDLDIKLHQINGVIDQINDQFKEMRDVRWQYNDYVRSHDFEGADPEEAAHWLEVIEDYETRYDDLRGNIKALAVGGSVKDYWVQGSWEDAEAGIWSAGYHQNSQRVSLSLKNAIQNAETARGKVSSALNTLVKDCEKADKKKKELKKKLDALETTLNTPGACSADLQKGLNEPVESNGNRSIIEVYRAALNYDLEPMARAVRGDCAPVLDELKTQLQNIGYGDWKYDGPVLSLDELKNIKNISGMEIDVVIYNENHDPDKRDWLNELSIGKSLCEYDFPAKLKPFNDGGYSTTKNPEFYEYLQRLFANEGEKVKKKNAKKAATKIFAQAQEIFKGLGDYEPEGAYLYTPYAGGSGETAQKESFGSEGDWTKEGEGKDAAKGALKSDLVDRLGNIAGATVDHLLLLGYDSEMFSCWTTNKGEETGRTSMAGIPLGIDVNYFYQSELEFLYSGSYNAQDNLQAVSGMIFLVRFVFNYIASFQIEEVNALVDAVKEALAGIAGPFAFIIGELVRVGMALGESALDVSKLRNGESVALMKNDQKNNWMFSMSGLARAIADPSQLDSVGYTEKSTISADKKDPMSMSYRDYLRVFLLLQDGNNLAQRTQKLIELNLTNKKNGIGAKGDHKAREAAMSAVPLVDLSKATTGFTITTTAQLRMLFLSLPVAQRGVDGKVPPGSVPLSITDYRGY